MDWREVISKRKQIKDKSRQKPQTRMAGGKPNLLQAKKEQVVLLMKRMRIKTKECF